MYSTEQVIELLLKERTRATEIALQSYQEHEEKYRVRTILGNELAFIQHEIGDEARLIAMAISGGNALSSVLGETMEERVIRYHNLKPILK